MVIRERIAVGAPVLPAPESGLTTSRWTFTRGGAFSLRLGIAPGTPWQRLASSFQCGPVSGAALTLTFVGSRNGESVSLPLDGRRASEFITYYPECPGGEDGWGPFHIVGYAHETIPMGMVEAGDAVDVSYVANGLTVPLRAPATVDSTMAVSPGGVLEVTGEAWMPVGDLYVSFDTFYGRLAETLDLTAAPDTLTAPNEEAVIALQTSGLPPDSLVTFRVPDLVRGGLRRASDSTGTPTAALSVPASEAVAGIRFVAAAEVPPDSGRVAVTATALGRKGTVRLAFGAGPLGLDVTAISDTLDAGDETAFEVDAPGLDPSTPVTFSVPDLSLGGFTTGLAPRAQTQAAVTTTLAGVASVRFRATDEAPATAESVTVQVSAVGRTGSDVLTVLPAVAVRLIRQNDAAVPATGPGAYVMVSKVRPDWLLPMSEQPPNTGFGSTPFLNVSATAPPGASVFDPHTYRVQVDGLPDSLATPGALDRFRYRYEVLRGGIVVYTSAARAGSGLPDLARGATTVASASRAGRASGQAIRSHYYFRLVSNGLPSVAGDARPYDDEVRHAQTILVALGDVLRVTAFVVSPDQTQTQILGQVSLPVGQNPAEASADAIRQADLVWHTYVDAVGNTLNSAPELATARASEDWAQASVRFHERAADRTTFSSAGIVNGLQIEVRAGGMTPTAGELFVDAQLPNGTVLHGRAAYPASSPAHAIAFALAEDFDRQLRAAGLTGVTAYWDRNGTSQNRTYAALAVGRLRGR